MKLITQIIKERFGVHRGLESPYALPNSKEAIKSAVDLHPAFVEFDVILENNEVKTAHPPQKPLDKLDDFIGIFNENNTFPKIDIKLKADSFPVLIDKVVEIAKKLKFVLLNVSGFKTRKEVIKAEDYCAEKIRNVPNIKLNIDLARYRPPGKELDNEIEDHIENIKDVVFSVSPEIHEENWDLIMRICVKYNIKNCCFWLRGWPDVPDPKVEITTIYKAVELENKYNVKIYFDINLNHIKDLKLEYYD
ncbi:MAG: hypothetical protein ACTSQP_12265 [Promethearchaeota archaeon]